MRDRYSFIELFTEKISLNEQNEVNINRIIIPKIQRSYAQGRKNETFIRDNILNDIFTAITSDTLMELNFIYGTVVEADNKYDFELLDGQQRLTTLFLLYWYIGNKELQGGSPQLSELQIYLSKFVYETRKTATDFCQELAKYTCNLDKRPSVMIKKAKWYFKSFDKDSTVEAMLVMLDSIHEKYKNRNQDSLNLYGKLHYLQFYVLSLGEFGLTEELYIKMNARGLPLSPFDNFKAELIGFMKNDIRQKGFYSRPTILINSSKKSEVPYYLNISTKLDTSWIDIFWNKNEKEFDRKYFSFFYRYFASKYILDFASNINSRDMRHDKDYEFLNRISEEEQGNRFLGFNIYEEMLKDHPEYIKSTEKVLDCLRKHYISDIKPNMNPSWDDEAWDIFDQSRFTQTKRIILSAITEFIEAYDEFDVDIFKKWMRIAWNIVENTNIDNVSAVTFSERNLSRIIRFTAEYQRKQETNFFEALANYKDEESDDSEDKERSRPLHEELVKAKRIANDPTWEQTFIEAESHELFKGMVGFFYSPNIDQRSFMHRYSLIKDVFDKNGVCREFREEGHLFLRGMISCLQKYDELNNLNLTDEVEKGTYLKNLLASNHNVREFIRNLFDRQSLDEVKDVLRNVVQKDSEITAWDNHENSIIRFRRVHESLYKEPAFQNWIQNEKAIRVKWFLGNIFTLRPGAWYSKVMLDTERNLVIPQIVADYGFRYCDNNQANVYKQTAYFFGNSVDIEKIYDFGKLKLCFDNESTLKVLFQDNNASQLGTIASLLGISEDDKLDNYLIVKKYTYSGKDIYSDIKEQILGPSGVLEKITSHFQNGL